MRKYGEKPKIKQKRGWVQTKPSMPFAHGRKKKSKSLDHGLLLMLFFSCKRNKIEQKSLFMFLHLCDSIYIECIRNPFEQHWNWNFKKNQNSVMQSRHMTDDTMQPRQGQQRKRRKNRQWESSAVQLINTWIHYGYAFQPNVTPRVPFLPCQKSYFY